MEFPAAAFSRSRAMSDTDPVLESFFYRALDVALSVHRGERRFTDAVDIAWACAAGAGLCDYFGEDAIQDVLRRAFIGTPKTDARGTA